MKTKILYVTHEMTPYLELTEIAEAARALPQYMQEQGHEVRVFMPRFGVIKERKHRLHEVIRLSGINVPVGDDDNPLIIKVASLPSAKMQIYFLDNEDYFVKRGVFADEGSDKFYADNDERTIFFNKGVLEIILKLGWIPDIIHCHGWMSSLVPMYARTIHKHETVFKNSKFVYTPYRSEFEGTLGKKFTEKAMVTGQPKSAYTHLADPSCNDLYMAGVTFADGITIGSSEVDDSVRGLIATQDKPVMSYQPATSANFAENHYELYQTLLGQGVLEVKN